MPLWYYTCASALSKSLGTCAFLLVCTCAFPSPTSLVLVLGPQAVGITYLPFYTHTHTHPLISIHPLYPFTVQFIRNLGRRPNPDYFYQAQAELLSVH